MLEIPVLASILSNVPKASMQYSGNNVCLNDSFSKQQSFVGLVEIQRAASFFKKIFTPLNPENRSICQPVFHVDLVRTSSLCSSCDPDLDITRPHSVESNFKTEYRCSGQRNVASSFVWRSSESGTAGKTALDFAVNGLVTLDRHIDVELIR